MPGSQVRRRDGIHGKGRIAGVSPGLVTVDGTPAARDVTLILRSEQRVVARTVSAGDGSYEFGHLDEAQTFVVFAWDRHNEHNAAIADNITPALMPEYEP
jgi:hypothetical protein